MVVYYVVENQGRAAMTTLVVTDMRDTVVIRINSVGHANRELPPQLFFFSSIIPPSHSYRSFLFLPFFSPISISYHLDYLQLFTLLHQTPHNASLPTLLYVSGLLSLTL